MLSQLAHTIETTLVDVMETLSDFVYYHPAWFVLGMMFIYHSMSWICSMTIKKHFTPERCTNVMITGGAQGLGKLLAEQFIRRSQLGSVNLIVVDIRGDLEAQLMKDIKALTGDCNFKNMHFYKANLADVEGTKQMWA